MSAAARLFRSARGLARGAADLLLPESCQSCGAPRTDSDGLCDDCGVRLLSLVSLPYCPRCGATVGPNIPVREDGCSACPDPLGRFARVVRLGPYAPPLSSVVREIKYRRQEGMRRRLGVLLARAVLARTDDAETFDVAIGVPMHWRRRISRGCDHARILAASVARRLDVPLGRELGRVRNTPPQVHLPRTRRIENVRGAFAVRDQRAVAGANVLLIDDVTTTGATADEAARTLLRAGALRVTLAVVAKSEPPTAYTRHWA